MFQWNPNIRNLLKKGTLEEETLCHEMIEIGHSFLVKKIGYEKPGGWSFAKTYIEQIENYIMEQSIPGTYTSEMIKVAADHAAFIADYGWTKYSREVGKPQDVDSVKQFFYDGSFDDYDPKQVEIKDPFEHLKDPIVDEEFDVYVNDDILPDLPDEGEA